MCLVWGWGGMCGCMQVPRKARRRCRDPLWLELQTGHEYWELTRSFLFKTLKYWAFSPAPRALWFTTSCDYTHMVASGRERAKEQGHSYLHIVPKEVAPVFISQLFVGKQGKHKVLWCSKWTILSHTWDSCWTKIKVMAAILSSSPPYSTTYSSFMFHQQILIPYRKFSVQNSYQS